MKRMGGSARQQPRVRANGGANHHGQTIPRVREIDTDIARCGALPGKGAKVVDRATVASSPCEVLRCLDGGAEHGSAAEQIDHDLGPLLGRDDLRSTLRLDATVVEPMREHENVRCKPVAPDV
jgi:hypothetical protein